MLLLLFACTRDPIVHIASPADGSYAALGDTVQLSGTASSSDEDMRVRWTVNGSEVDGDATFANGEATFSFLTHETGSLRISLEATAGEDHTGSDSITLNVFENVGPTVSFILPVAGSAVDYGPVEVVASIADADAVPGQSELSLTWTDDATGAVTAPTFLDAPGEVHFLLDGLDAGAHQIGLTATDRFGGSGSGTVTFDLRDPPPDTGDTGENDTGDTDTGADTGESDTSDSGESDTSESDTGESDTSDSTRWDSAGDTAPPVTDLDGDGYIGTADGGDDCDDSDPAVHPGAGEVCDDGVDNDCDGTDESCGFSGSISLGDADVKLTGQSSAALAGHALDGAGDLDGDGYDDLIIGSWADGTGGTIALVDGASIRSGSLSSATRITAEATGDALGYAVAGCGDTDGDGTSDIVFGAPANGSGKGAVYLWLGSAGSGTAGSAEKESDGSSGDAIGTAIDCGLDVDDDGAPDMIAGGPGNSNAYVYDAASLKKTARFTGGTALGQSVALLPDIDGDGIDDIVVGDDQKEAAYLLLGSASLGNTALTTGNDAAYTAAASGDQAGASVAGLGDTNGDGYGDLLVGAPENDTGGSASGAAYLILGQSAPVDVVLSAADAVFWGDDAADRAGAMVAGPGDVDGDGLSDILVGAYYDEAGGTGSGTAALFYGSLSPASLDLGSAGARFIGESTGDSASEGLAGAGDVDGDGLPDILVGSPSEGSAYPGAGAAYLFLTGP